MRLQVVGVWVGVGDHRFAPANAPLCCALPGGHLGLALDVVVGRLFA